MAVRSDENILLSIGTKDGLYFLEGTRARDRWEQWGPYLAGLDVAHAILDHRDGQTVWAAATGNGCTAVYRSPDRGESWEMAGEPFDCDMVWHVEPGHASTPGRVFAGVRPAGLYVSDDGSTWRAIDGINHHDSSGEWWEGGGGKILHTILIDPADPNDLTVGISVAGVFHSADAGITWNARNEGIESMAEALAESGVAVEHPEVHRCVHKIVRHPSRSDVLFQQNHDGVFRSDNRGESWVDICDGVRDRFGFVIGATRDGSVFVVPQDMDQVRYTGQLEVYRMRDGQTSWDRLTAGLPEVENITLYREGMATDKCLPGGVYFGTSEGDVYFTRDGGERWQKMTSGLPGIRSVSCEHTPPH